MDSDQPVYQAEVLDKLEAGEGVACFAALSPDGDPIVLFASHRLAGKARAVSFHTSEHVRAAQALAIQREARRQAVAQGFEIVVS
jgi:hypothetical protein